MRKTPRGTASASIVFYDPCGILRQWLPVDWRCALSRKRLAMRVASSQRCLLRIGMTLVELLVVVAIIGVLVALLLPAVQAARESARRAQCQNNLRQVGVALHVYHNANRELPIGCIEKRVPSSKPDGRQHAWSSAILPHLEEPALWASIDFGAAYDAANNFTAARETVAAYLCPSTWRVAPGRDGSIVADPFAPAGSPTYRGAAIDYGGIYGTGQMSPSANGTFLYDRPVKLSDVTDGTSHTLAVAEDSGRGWLTNGEWINGENIFDVGGPINRQQDNEIWSDHPGGAMVLWCDGSVELLSEATELNVVRAMCSRGRGD
jgi:prepilin-type processing-associated H-X9-DG protein/prepilin-type N-terminal cleavage/methylation domain-containing protein